ncbi:hypothetical protein POL68_38700 [Stigmatella sp. ncwal1]|uniref:Chaperonin n=1 Tax=Stigmatella ashevillensis TaxID=2995309 RepID=A0ABT5DLA9_9BACT|nr:hypothetical protein [Stigmatella ashevillena]MDC0714450.1 hypothetical protein [Stigmatella ashevillena]
MAKATKAKMGGSVRRQGRRVMPALRRSTQRMKPSKKKTGPLTVGELIAAAFDTAGGEIAEVLKVVTSPQLSKALGLRIVVVS